MSTRPSFVQRPPPSSLDGRARPHRVAPVLAGLVVLASSGNVSAQTISPDGARVVFMEDQDANSVLELYSVAIDGSQAPLQLALAPGAGVHFYAYYTVSPDSSLVAYFCQEQGSSSERVHAVPIDGSAGPFVYDFPMPGISEGDTDPWFEIGPLSDHVVYWHEGYAIYGAPIDGSAPVSLLSGDATYVSHFVFDPAGPRIVFRSNSDFPGLELFGAKLDGSSGPIPLRGAIDSGSMGFFEITPDGSRVAYTANQDSSGVVELYSVPSDASASPIKLNPPIVAGGGIQFDFQLSPDGARVVYRADQDVDSVVEIYSVPIDGSGSSVQLNGALVAGGNVSQGFRISPDGAHVAYLADQGTNEVFELFSRPIDGSGTSVRLNGALAAGGDVAGFQISAGGRVVFRADKDANDVFELYSVPIEGRFRRKFARPGTSGSWLLVQLNRPLVAGGDVIDFAISPDGGWVVYRADQDVNDVTELYSVPTDGGTAIQLNDPLAPGASIYFVGISSGNRVVYNVSGEIFSVPIDRSTAPVLLNP